MFSGQSCLQGRINAPKIRTIRVGEAKLLKPCHLKAGRREESYSTTEGIGSLIFDPGLVFQYKCISLKKFHPTTTLGIQFLL